MILIDTGPLVALFDPKDALHGRCKTVLRTFKEPLSTTVPVLTAAEALNTRKIFTIDRNDFSTYRMRRGHRNEAFKIVG